jgi:hypothetical protein
MAASIGEVPCGSFAGEVQWQLCNRSCLFCQVLLAGRGGEVRAGEISTAKESSMDFVASSEKELTVV